MVDGPGTGDFKLTVIRQGIVLSPVKTGTVHDIFCSYVFHEQLEFYVFFFLSLDDVCFTCQTTYYIYFNLSAFYYLNDVCPPDLSLLFKCLQFNHVLIRNTSGTVPVR